MRVEKLKEIILSNFSHILFTYNGKNCGIDPLGVSNFDVWCGDNNVNVDSIDKVTTVPIFDGKSLTEIISSITDFEY